ncbi:MAG: DNA gyrase C-terminal beta-propeller domain-containing protein, partial [Rivularia sp. (in: cyanobacteria)]
GRATRGVRAMKLRKGGDELVGMDILPADILNNITPATGTETEAVETEAVEAEAVEAEAVETEVVETENAENAENAETVEVADESNTGLWVLVITTGGYGKRVPVGQFRLQNRAGQGLMATKFKNLKTQDSLASLHIVSEDNEIMMVTNRGIIIRQAVNAISIQSRSATGVRVQRLDQEDFLNGVAIVPGDSGEESDESLDEDDVEVAADGVVETVDEAVETVETIVIEPADDSVETEDDAVETEE